MAVPPAGDFAVLPSMAAWEHLGARSGFEVVRLTSGHDGVVIEGSTSAVEDGRPWWVRYRIEVDAAWRTRRAEIDGGSSEGILRRSIEVDGPGRWLVDGLVDHRFDGCLDVDLEASAVTNTIPVHRIGPRPPGPVDAPAVYVRALDLAVERLEQSYAPVAASEAPHGGSGVVLEYEAARFDYHELLTFDRAGLVLDYPGLARRAV